MTMLERASVHARMDLLLDKAPSFGHIDLRLKLRDGRIQIIEESVSSTILPVTPNSDDVSPRLQRFDSS